MALPSIVHRATIELCDSDRGRFETLRADTALHPSETPQRLLLRMLAYALFHEEGLAFSKGVCAGDEPDLWSHQPDGRVALWLEVGTPKAVRLIKAARHAERVRLLVGGDGFERWARDELPKLEAAGSVSVYRLAGELLDELEGRLERNNAWSLTVSGGALYLTDRCETLEGELVHLTGPALEP